MPKISVLLPIYNTKEEYLRTSIESILNQTYKDFELLILNDSPDNYKLDEIVKSYKDIRIRYFKNDKNLGITPSRNKLLKIAQCEYLAIMDHDDISLPTRFEKEVQFLDNNPDIGVIGCNAKSLGSNILYHHPEKDNDIKLMLLNHCVILHPTSMIRNSVLKNNNIKYEEKYSPAEDYALWCRLIPFTNFYNIQEELFIYRYHDTNTSKTQLNKLKNNANKIRIFVKNQNPELYDEFLAIATKTVRIHLFGVIPFLYIKKNNKHIKIYLFKFILIISIKTNLK